MKGLKGFITIIFIIALIAKAIVCCKSDSQQSNDISDSTLVKNTNKCLDNSKNFINIVL
jgi:hypothetical protein